MQLRLGPCLQGFQGHPGDHVAHDEAARRHVEHRQVGVDAFHHTLGGQRIGAALPDTRLAVLGGVLHHHPEPLRADREIHRAADLLHRFVGRAGPVGDVAVLRHLERAQHAQIQMPAARDGEAVGVMHIGSAGAQRDMRGAGVDQERIDGIGCRRGADADHAVLGMEDHLAVRGHEVGDQRRNADAEIDQPAFGNVARAPRGHAVAIERGDLPSGPSQSGTCSTRSTKMPGVTMVSGVSSPSATTLRVIAMVSFAAIAITGLKFRALSR